MVESPEPKERETHLAIQTAICIVTYGIRKSVREEACLKMMINKVHVKFVVCVCWVLTVNCFFPEYLLGHSLSLSITITYKQKTIQPWIV